VSIEDGAVMGGAGSAVAEFLISSKYNNKLLTLGLPDEFIMQGTQQEMYAELGLDCEGILSRIATFNSVE
jgi:1-deoxy-D-xylulose-5-phosphate synthase